MCYPADSIASATTASFPTPIAPTISHWPASSSAYPTRPRRARTAMAPIVVAKMKSPTFVLAAADAWSSSRPSNLAASLGSGPSHRSGSTAHDHNAVAATPHHCAWSRPVSRRQRTRSAYRNRQRPLRPPKRRSLGATSSSRSRPGRPSQHRATGAAGALVRNPRSDQIPAPNPHRLIPPPATTPPRFPPLRLFGRLPPYARSRLCLAGVRKPLT